MKKTLKVVVVIAVLTGVGFFVARKISKRRKLDQVADNGYLDEVAENGYETAHDVLFPRKEIKSKKLHYGPVHPGVK